MNIKNNVAELVGNTPLMAVENFSRQEAINARILVKLEYFNPAGSVKDRVALNMIEEAETRGELTPDSVIIEPTSGNTGIGLAAIANSKGYKLILTMPDSMSVERRRLLSAYGAEIVLTEGRLGMQGAVDKANELKANYKNSFIAGQFENPDNPDAHYRTTGPEIWRDTDGKVDVVVSCFGTGGTISGVGKYLKEQNPNIKIIGVEPADSPLVSKGKAGPHKIQGIGANFIPENLKRDVIDDIVTVSTKEAYSAVRDLAKLEGVLVGISSGAALSVAKKLAQAPENRGKIIVAILPDTGERYLSCEVFE